MTRPCRNCRAPCLRADALCWRCRAALRLPPEGPREIPAAAARLGCRADTIRERLRRGWDRDAALTTPLLPVGRPPRVLLTYRGETRGVAEWARALGIPPSTLTMRLRAGWSVDRALGTPVRAYPTRAA